MMAMTPVSRVSIVSAFKAQVPNADNDISDFVATYLLQKESERVYRPFNTLSSGQVAQLINSLVEAWARFSPEYEQEQRRFNAFEGFKASARTHIDAFLRENLEIDPNSTRTFMAAHTQPGVIDNLAQGANYAHTLLTEADIKAALGDLAKGPVTPGNNVVTGAVLLTGAGGSAQALTTKLQEIQTQLREAQLDQVTRVGVPINLSNGHWNAGVFEFHGSQLTSAKLVDSMDQASAGDVFKRALASFNVPQSEIHIEATGRQSAAQNGTHCGDYAMQCIVRELGADQHPLTQADDNPQALRDATVAAILSNDPAAVGAATQVAPPPAAVKTQQELVQLLQGVLPVQDDAPVVIQNFFGTPSAEAPATSVAASSVAIVAPAPISASVNAKALVVSLLEDKKPLASSASEADIFAALVREQTRAFQQFHNSAAFKSFKNGHETSFDK